jgi:hypothetical protein
MSSYQIKKYSFNQAKKLGVTIKPSTNPKKKIDVFKDDIFLFSLGDINYKGDYATYLETQGEELAVDSLVSYHRTSLSVLSEYMKV